MRAHVAALAALLFPVVALAANPQLGFTELVANQSQPHVVVNGADRAITQAFAGQVTVDFSSDANLTLSSSQWKYGTIRLTDTGMVLTAGRDVVYPDADSQTGGTSRMTFVVENDTAQALTVKRSGQTGVAVAAGSSALLHHDGTDVVAVAASGGSDAPDDATYITQTPDGDLTSEQALSALSSGIMRVATTTGVVTSLGDTLPVANGGTNLTAATDDDVMVGNGTTWQSKAVSDCDDSGGNHLNYDTATNAFSCGTSSSGGGGGGSPGGSDTNVQYNDGGTAFGGEADFTWDATSNRLRIGSTGTSGKIVSAPGSSSHGGDLSITTGAGDGANKVGGAMTLSVGAAGSGSANGKAISITAGAGASSAGIGGNVNITGGIGSGPNAGGTINLRGGEGGGVAFGDGGPISIVAGEAGPSGGNGGSVELVATDSNNGAGSPGGGSVVIRAGAGSSNSLAGSITFQTRGVNATAQLRGDTNYFSVKKGNVTFSSTNSARVGGLVYADNTQTGNGAGSETDAFSHTVDANTLNTNEEALEFEAAGTIANTANTDKRIKVVFGGTTCLDTGSMAITASASWRVVGSVVRTGSTAQKCSATLTTSDAGVPVKVGYATPAETLSGSVTMKMTVNATGASDVVAEYYREKWAPAQ